MKGTSCCIVSLWPTSFSSQNVVFPAHHCTSSDIMLQDSAVSLCLNLPPALVTDISLSRTGPVQGQHINPLSVCTLCPALLLLASWVGPSYWIVYGFVLASLFFLSAPKSWPIYSNPIIIEAWLSRVIDGAALKLGYCWCTHCSYCFSLQKQRLGTHTHTRNRNLWGMTILLINMAVWGSKKDVNMNGLEPD